MRILFMFFLLFSVVLMPSCKTKGKPGSEEATTTENQNGKIRNGIKVNSKGVQVEQAFLTYEDGTLVDANNKTNVNKKIILNLVIEGWQAQNDQVALEASEKVTTNSGEIILDIADLFSKSGIETVPPEEAKYVKLNVVITQLNKLSDYYQVQFKVWNKQADQSVSGSYKFYIG